MAPVLTPAPVLFAGVPGGAELLVILIVMIVLLGVPAVVVLAGGVGYLRLSGDGDGDGNGGGDAAGPDDGRAR